MNLKFILPQIRLSTLRQYIFLKNFTEVVYPSQFSMHEARHVLVLMKLALIHYP